MNEFVQEFTIHPVGQGLFYSGKIVHNGQVKFRMVFDCGSLTKNGAEPEIELYRKDSDFLKEKTLDLLVISHFDADHINKVGKLLEGGIKVKKLVMPVVSFEERLFLLARHLEEKQESRPDDDDFAERFLCHPLRAMDNYLDGDSEIFLAENGEGPPTPGFEKGEQIAYRESQDRELENRFEFDFENKRTLKPGEIDLSFPIGRKVFSVKDSDLAHARTYTDAALMEFVFYRRFVGNQEEAFFKKVKESFMERYKWDGGDLNTLVEIMKKIKSSTSIREILSKAASSVKARGSSDFVIGNPNTTALCLLHRNLIGIGGLSGRREPAFDFKKIKFEVKQLQKFMNDSSTQVKNHLIYYPFFHYYNETPGKFPYPNVLLTSDAFLLTDKQVSDLIQHYEGYWQEFWLFQVPHHGSKENSNQLLHAQIPFKSSIFINSGTQNRDGHPSPEVIQSLVATGHGSRMIPVNEFQGLRFTFVLEDRTK